MGVVVQFGGQTAIKLAKDVDAAGVPILGTQLKDIDAAEDREEFDALLERLRMARPAGPYRVYRAKRRSRRPTSWATPCWCAPPMCWAARAWRSPMNDAGHPRIYGHHRRSTSRSIPFWWINTLMGKEIGGGRHLRRQGCTDSRHHGAYRAGRHPFGRFHLGVPGRIAEPPASAKDDRYHHQAGA